MIVDITEKLNFEENPKLVICGEELEVNSDAETMLKLMGVFSNGFDSLDSINAALSLIFTDADRKKLGKIKKDGKKLSSKALMTIIQEAINLLTEGEEEKSGDPTTT